MHRESCRRGLRLRLNVDDVLGDLRCVQAVVCPAAAHRLAFLDQHNAHFSSPDQNGHGYPHQALGARAETLMLALMDPSHGACPSRRLRREA